MRIGIVCPYDMGSPGGVQQLTSELAEILRRAGEEVTLVGAGRTWFRGGPEADLAVGRPISIRANRSRAPLTLSPTSVLRVRRALKGVDVIHVHEPMVPLVGWVALTVDKPLVATFHADPPPWVSAFYRRAPLVTRRLRKSVLTAVSEAAAGALPEKWGRVRIVPNAIDVESYRLPVGKVARRVCFLGRDEPRKGLDLLLEAWPRISREVEEAELLVLGAERDLPIPGVRFAGRVSGGEKRRLLATASVFVAPNTGGESFGIVLLEAMAAGCVVVASDLPAFKAVVDEAGLGFPVGDSAVLAEQVVKALTEETLGQRLRERAAQRVEPYDWSQVIERYRELYVQAAS